VSLKFRILFLITAGNVAVLLLVIWLGLRTAESGGPVNSDAIDEAFRIAHAESLEEAQVQAVHVLFVVRKARASNRWDSSARDAEREVAKQRLQRLIDRGDDYWHCDHNGLTVVHRRAKNVEWQAYYAAFNERARWEALASLRNVYVVLCAGTVLLVGATFLVLNRLFFRPLATLVDAVREMGEGRSPRHVKVRGPGEMARLASGFNAMSREVRAYQTRLEDRVRDALGRAKTAESRLVVAQRLASTGTLAAGFAHEINNPVGGVMNAVRKLRDGSLSAAKRDEYFELALDGLDRIRVIVERILHFTPRQSEAADLDVRDVCDRAVGLARHRAEQRGIHLDLQAAEPVAGVVGDPREMTQALLNLILNAIDAVPEGQPGRVAVEARAEGETAVLRVEDDGVGMDEETRLQCVDLFFSTKPEGEGTGLGLAIVQHIVTDHGGTMDVESAPGEGTAIEIRLPRTPPPA